MFYIKIIVEIEFFYNFFKYYVFDSLMKGSIGLSMKDPNPILRLFVTFIIVLAKDAARFASFSLWFFIEDDKSIM